MASATDAYSTLMRLNIERDNLMAHIDDEELRAKAEANPHGIAAIWWKRRQSRRKAEHAAGLQHAIPPGPWSTDLDLYHDPSYDEVHLGDDYFVRLWRDPETWVWKVTLILPEGHCCVGKSVDVIGPRRTCGDAGQLAAVYLSRRSDNAFDIVIDDEWGGQPYRAYTADEAGAATTEPRKYLTCGAMLYNAQLVKERLHRIEEKRHLLGV